MLTTSSWDPGWFISARMSQPETSSHGEIHSPPEIMPSGCTQGPEQFGPGKGIRHVALMGLCPHEAPRSPSGMGLGSPQCLESQKSPCCPSTASAPHTRQWHLQYPYLSTAQVSKWARISGHFCSLVSGQTSDTEERLATRGGQHEQRKEGRTAPEVQGTTDSNPAVK